MTPRRKHRLVLLMVLLVGLGLATALVMYALRANIDLFYTPGEMINGKGDRQLKPETGQRLRVGGMVMPGSVKRDPHSLQVVFKLYDASGVISVSYDGILPDLFREGQGVVAQGVLRDATHVIAKEVLAKHDEKYTPPEINEAMKNNHSAPVAGDNSVRSS
ncbi:cytochrome c maturation protein CcmE [Erwinia amylovora]|uniref:Cytochrome c-type biogenesis protein CcmE n=4 Tax=Erwinia amylovora TaxID=552 RepID=A0A831EKE9_ERWAM|nr:cytochrome c maturation protein CcmE [Erwinia amylovora]CBX81331.1 Cytochrome c-type biogenesis protein CcmE [Erwinia amylovora ATCC BAA-2158]CDK15859.1 Cytochrome c-type biogenesis protein ccmE [Erwinia amylovora LA635]CDK19225.1 Cytochrome c-type biogenesis protein ccmE [Erwinia amylovora LA636]CDK22596.1 Cytochrome c-type biogenesis protein ccmE [Erwinia amylovora LA637]ATZ12139.1 cytochrome c maturation protein CcmE [Erwinia amylovora]